MSTTATTRILHAAANASLEAENRSWVWPLPRLDGVAPCIIQATGAASVAGVAIGYPDRDASPELVPVFAAQDGIVTYAGTTADGSTLCIDHAGGWSTHYAELEHLLARPTDRFSRRRKERVGAGDVIGHARRTTLRIRFGLSRLTDDGCVEQELATSMAGWSLLPWFTESAAAIVAGSAG